MALEQTWRWFGPQDPISLKEIRQTGATGIVTALHQVPVGEVWPVEEIQRRKAEVEAGGFTWSVAESIPVHEQIKIRGGGFRTYIENYRASVRNLGKCGIDTVCYNFMPVLDWTRTNLRVPYRDGSQTTRFEAAAFAAFDLYMLKRKGAERDYTDTQKRRARAWFEGMDEARRRDLQQTVLLGFPGSGEAYSLEQLRQAVLPYGEVGEEGLRENLQEFVREIAPTAAESDVFLALHPDDPPWPLIGLPRVVGSREDMERVVEAVALPSNGFTLCTGSLGAGHGNDLVELAGRFARRIAFIHLRNVSRNREGDFLEENHLEGDVDLYGVVKALVLEQQRRVQEGSPGRRMPFRPDHGHLMSPESGRQGVYPGYSLLGRMRGLAELRGLELGVRRSLGL